jgi:hypothetical protein
MQIKLETVPQYRSLDVGELMFGFRVLATVPGSNQFILDIPADQMARFEAFVATPEVIDWRPAHDDYSILGWPVTGPVPFATPGDTFPLVMAPECPERGRWGARATRLGILDTGVDSGHVAFDGKDVQGDLADGHGHGTHCASTAASAWGIASDSAILMLNVLPGGQGTEVGVANGFRALADAGSARVSAARPVP